MATRPNWRGTNWRYTGQRPPNVGQNHLYVGQLPPNVGHADLTPVNNQLVSQSTLI